MTKRTLLIFVIVVFTQLMFGVIRQSYTFSEPTVKVEGDFSKIVMASSFLNGVASQPEIPYKGVMLYLPTSEEVTSVNVKRSNAQEIKLDKPLFPAQQQYPLSLMEQAKFTEPNRDIYNSAKAFPAEKSKNIRTDFMAGHSVGSFAVALVDYYPQENRLVWYAEITIEVETEITAAGEEAQLLRKDTESVVARLSRSVDNPEMIPMPTDDERSVGINYLIIYPEAYLTQIEQIKQYHNIRNRTVKLLSMEYIQANEVPNGASYRDLQEKIREYIKYHYSQPANDIQYVLLAGDDEVIPHRGFYSNNDVQEDYDIPADCYYSNLDRDFDANGNGVFGEQMDADLMPELAIGRMCYNNPEELDNIIHKLHKFSEEPVLGSIKSSLMVGEYLWEGPTWGGDHMDELIGFTNIHGYQTDGFPEEWAYSKVYDRDYGYSDAWSNIQLYPHLSQGHTYVNHLGHSFTNYNMRLSNRHVTPQNISNNGVTANYSVHFTQGCYAGSFDNRGTSPGSYGDDCITEKFTAISTSAVAMISHSRYGWGVQGSTNGASQKYHRQWANAIFTEEIDAIGETLNECKIANIPSMDSPTMYWIYYQTNLFGDPAMTLWRDEPNTIEENVVTTWTLGQPSYPLDIITESATAALLNSDNELLWRGEKDILGNINVSTTTTLMAGEYTLVLNAPQCLPKVLTITVEQDDTPFIAIHDIEEVNSNNLFGATDVISFNLTAQNHSSFDLNEDAYVKLISLNEFVEVTQDSLYIGHLLGNETIEQHGVFEIRNLGGHEDLEEALLRFTTYFGTQQSVTQKQITLNASNVSLGSVAVVGSALSPEAGVQNPLTLTFENNGSGFARGIELIFYSYFNGITITPNSYSIPEIEPHQTITIEDIFSLNITASVEDYSPGNMVVTIVDPYYDVNEYFYDFLVGLNEYSFETGDDGFISEQPNDDYTNQWHRSNNQNNTPNGQYSFKFGGVGAGHYTNHAYGYLVSPEFNIVSGSVFKFSHKMNAENDNQDEFAAWDGGYVEMSVNGGNYNIIEPVGGYPYYLNNNPANLIPGSTPVYSGIIQWSQAEFNLGTVSGNVRFRFVFGSDALTVREGWYVDDIFVEQPATDNITNEVELTQIKIKGNYPNPFNPETTIEYLVPNNDSKSLQMVNIEIYNLKGQKVKTLLNENKSPGNYRITWKGVNDDSQPVSSGIYFTKIKVGNVTDLHKMVLMK